MKLLFKMVGVVFIGVLVDVAIMHYQAKNGKLPFTFKIFPNAGVI